MPALAIVRKSVSISKSQKGFLGMRTIFFMILEIPTVSFRGSAMYEFSIPSLDQWADREFDFDPLRYASRLFLDMERRLGSTY
ncbi:hypothetical protein EJ110_NYTH43554 [Nymphaea thermarum]|nr:hypothetical protein EJ110_NYTH43554 [Nymphaea thermarum]